MTEDNNTTAETENVVRFGAITGGRVEDSTIQPNTSEIPQNDYVVTDIEGNEFYAEGFLLFTSQHIAIMRDTGSGALPVLVMPLNMVKRAELFEEDEVFSD